MTDNVDSTHRFAGLVFALVSAVVPEGVMSIGEKLAIAVFTAFVTGMSYRAGQILFDKLRGGQK